MAEDLKITLAQYNITIGDFETTINLVKKAVQLAKSENSKLIVFPELFLTGYPPLDKLEQNDFLVSTEKSLDEVKKLSREIGIIIGAPAKNLSGKGKSLYNSAYFFYKGNTIHQANKGHIPNYDIFDEYRYFEPADNFKTVGFEGHNLAITICQDLWEKSNSLEYKTNPVDILMEQNPTLLINIAASPFDCFKYETRKNILLRKAKETKLPLFYVNHIGAQCDLIFDGGSMMISPTGIIWQQLKFFEEDIKTFSVSQCENYKKDSEQPLEISEKLHKALVLGIKDFFCKNNFKTAVIGLSGGIDSALVTALSVEALGKENVCCVFMPTAYTSEESFKDALMLTKSLDVKLDVLDIENNFRNILKLLRNVFNTQPKEITEENIQSRLRALMLMAYSNHYGHILLNSSNKSEIATGYGTLYGDMCGSLAVIGDLYKTQVYELCKYLNRKKEIFSANLLSKAPSAELKPGQKDTDTLPPYSILDTILYHYIELGSSVDTIALMPDTDMTLTKKVIEMVDRNEFKRFQAPPVLRVSPKAFGTGRRFPLVAKLSQFKPD